MTPSPPPRPTVELSLPSLVRAVAVTGTADPRKTAVIGRLCAWFEAQGLAAAVLILGDAPDLGDQGKDTWRFRQAGASPVGLAGPGSWDLTFAEVPQSPSASLSQALAVLANHARVVFVDGESSLPLPRLVVGEPEAGLMDREILAVVSDRLPSSRQPLFHPEAVAELGRFLRERLGV